MSSERAGGLNRDWPGRADVFRSFNGELDQDIVDQLDRAHTPPERAGTPTHGTLNREAVLDAIRSCAPLNMELRPDGTEDREAAAYVEGVHTAYEAAKGALKACVVPDPRLARIEALLEQAVGALRRKGNGEQLWTDAAEACIAAEAALAILRNQ